MRNILARKINWPVGLGNQFALSIGLVLFLITFSSLIGQIFFHSGPTFRAPYGYDLVVKVISLVFTVILLAIRPLRERLPLILSAFVCLALVGVLGRVIVFLPDELTRSGAILYSVLGSLSTSLFCLGLLQGEKLF